MRLFENAIPKSFIWVSPNGNDNNPGSEQAPMASIQAAIKAAGPGTAVLVQSGSYYENVKITSNGTVDDPIWLVSVDGPQAATIIPMNENTSTVYGRGVDNFIIRDFRIDGADKQHGIEFTQAGRDYHNWVNNVVIENNEIFDTGFDGIKLAQANHVDVIGNVIIGGSEEAIDLVTVFDAQIIQNEIKDLEGRSGITTKGGSARILIEGNAITNVGADGITIGGWTDRTLLDDLSLEFQASHVTVKSNLIQGVEKRAVNVLGGQDSSIIDNYIDPQNNYPSTINIQSGRWGLASENNTIANNVITRADWLKINAGQDTGLKVHDNKQAGAWSHEVGSDAYQPTTLSWLEPSEPSPSSPAPPIPAPEPSDLVTAWQINQAFDGIDDKRIIDHDNSWSLTDGTITIGFNATETKGLQGLLSKDALNFGTGGHLTVWLDDDQLIVRLQDTNSSHILKSAPGSITANNDTHVALTFGAEGLELYLNGDLADTNSFSGGLTGNHEPIVVGARAIYSHDLSADVVTEFFEGRISDVAVHDTALSANEIRDLATSVSQIHVASPAPPTPAPEPSDLVTAWQINQAFDGRNDYAVQAHDSAFELSEGAMIVTFEASDTYGQQGLVSKDAKYFGDGGHLSIYLQGDRLIARLQDGDRSYLVESEPGSIKAGVEMTAALEFGAKGMQLFLNDQLVDTNSYTGGIEYNHEPLVVGASAMFSGDEQANALRGFFKGNISDVSLVTRYLNPTELEQQVSAQLDVSDLTPPLNVFDFGES